MKILFYLGHPAHFHLFKNTLFYLKENNVKFEIIIKSKEILEELLIESKLEYINIEKVERKANILSIFLSLLNRIKSIYSLVRKRNFTHFIGTSIELSILGRLLGVKSYIFLEDDFKAVPLFGLLAFPFAYKIVTPQVCNVSFWEYKSLKYNGYQKIAYLHKNNFKSNSKVLNKYNISNNYSLVRISALGAHHDLNQKQINFETVLKIVNELKKYGSVYISSEEKNLPAFLEEYRLKINISDYHHILANSSFHIGNSQSIAIECAIIGIPNVCISHFKDKIGVLNELSQKYNLIDMITVDEIDKFLLDSKKYFSKEFKNDFLENNNKMNEEKIDVTKFIIEKIIYTKNNMN